MVGDRQSRPVEPGGPTEPSTPAPAGLASPSLLPPGLVFADTPSRLAAYVIDGVLLSVLVSIPPALLGIYDYAYASYPYPEPMPRGSFIGVSILSFAAQAAYFLWFWTGGRRATPGQRVFGIQLGNAFDGRPLTMSQAIERWIVMGWWLVLPALLPFLALAVASYVALTVWWVVLVISMIRSPTKQGLHDRFARSALVRPAGEGNTWALGCLFIVFVALVLEVAALVPLLLVTQAYIDWGLLPPGLDPFDLITEQIREVWPL
jgi:hypothetical protein